MELVVQKQGVLFIAAGRQHIQAAINSANTVRKHCPGLPIHLYADWHKHDFEFDLDPLPFTAVGKIDNPHRRSKVDFLSKTPFEETIYLDNDSALNADIRDIFAILDNFDIALLPMENTLLKQNKKWRVEIPESFPQYNGGVIVYGSSQSVINLLKDWGKYYKEAGFRRDETTLRELLWLSKLRIYNLPKEYNARYRKHSFWSAKTDSTIKVYHLKDLHLTWYKRLMYYGSRRLKQFLVMQFHRSGIVSPKKKDKEE